MRSDTSSHAYETYEKKLLKQWTDKRQVRQRGELSFDRKRNIKLRIQEAKRASSVLGAPKSSPTYSNAGYDKSTSPRHFGVQTLESAMNPQFSGIASRP